MMITFLVALCMLGPQDPVGEIIKLLQSERSGDRDCAARELVKLGDAAVGELERLASENNSAGGASARLILKDIFDRQGKAVIEKIEAPLLRSKSFRIGMKGKGTVRLSDDT